MGIIADFGSLGESIFGKDEKKSQFGTKDLSQRTQGTTDISGTRTEQLQLEPEAIQKIIADVLGGANGLADIFSAEQNAGIFNSSVATDQAGDLVTGLVGELAKLTGKTVGTEDQSQVVDETVTAREVTTNEEANSSGGLLEASGLSALIQKTDGTGTIKKMRDEKLPFQTQVQQKIKQSEKEVNAVEQDLEARVTPQAVKDLEDQLSTIGQDTERAIGDQVISLLGL
jgi:hypothetical protein